MERAEGWDWVAYVDETFNDTTYRLCVVVLPVGVVEPTQDSLDAVVRKWSGEFGFSDDAELHGSGLWHGSGAYVRVPPPVRRAIYDDALEALAAAEPAIIVRGITRAGLYLHPHRLAWRYAIESVDVLMEEVGGTALVVADEKAEMERELAADIVEYAESTTGGYKARQITHVLRAPLFRPSTTNRLLQAADLVAFVYQRRQHTPLEPKARAQNALEAHWQTIRPWIRVMTLWTPRF